jgi:asparagine synthetase B (glutamine-hydrolysing)
VDYLEALSNIYKHDYYVSARFYTGAIPYYCVARAVRQRGIRVVLDGTGGDELFHGYKFRDDYRAVPDWPRTWDRIPYFYSLYTSLLDYTAKADRAGAYFSLETRFPFQTPELLQEALRLPVRANLKWPLREYLLKELDYGPPTAIDIDGKFGFSIKNKSFPKVVQEMAASWCNANGLLELPQTPPTQFPFTIGQEFFLCSDAKIIKTC